MNFIEFIDENCPLLPESIYNVLVMDDFVAHEHRRAEQIKCVLNDTNCAVYTCTESTGIS